MQLQETLDQLNSLGVQYIHEKTHISIYAIKAILAQDYTTIHPIQYSGFLNIIENELRIDVSALRKALEEYIQEHQENDSSNKLFIYTPEEKEGRKLIYIIAAIVVVVVVLFGLFSGDDDDEVIEVKTTSSKTIEEAKEKLSSKPVAVAEDISVPQFDDKSIKQDPVSKATFVLIPKSELWIGTIDLDTKTKKDTITDEPYILDENVNMLISLGHGQVDVKLRNDLQEYDTPKRLRFIYKDGVLRRIYFREFKELNDGQSW